MKHIYYKDAKGKKVQIEVTDEIATAYRESLREEWRGKAREKYQKPYRRRFGVSDEIHRKERRKDRIFAGLGTVFYNGYHGRRYRMPDRRRKPETAPV